MKYFTVVAALVSSANAAACPAAAALAERYGISFSGFDKPIPASSEPTTAGGGRYLRVPIASPVIVSDGFRHTAVMDTVTKNAWILRTGGFAGVYEWYGPVDVGDASLEDCVSEPRLAIETVFNPAPGVNEARGKLRPKAGQ